MKKELLNEIAMVLRAYMGTEELESVVMKITMLLNDYDISRSERSIVVYDQDETTAAIKKFVAAKIAKGCTPRTVKYYMTEVTKILRAIGKPYDQVTADDIRFYLAKRVQVDGVTKVTANSERRALSSFYQWLQMEEILLKNPMNKIEAIKEYKKKRKAFSKMEMEKIRDACVTAREQAMVEVLFSTWARVTEVVNIRVDEIEGGKIIVHGKGEKDREVYLTPKAELAIQKYLSERTDNNPYLFPRAKYAGDIARVTRGRKKCNQAKWYQDQNLVDENRPMNVSSMEGIIRKIGRKADVDKSHPHRFRRTGATMALRGGMPLLQVSKLLGHEQIGTTQIYLDITDEELMNAHDKYVL